MRYLTESGAAALATSSNMQALSYLYEVQTLIEETKDDEEPLAAEEETARVESLIGQVRVNFTDTAILKKPSQTTTKSITLNVYVGDTMYGRIVVASGGNTPSWRNQVI